MTATADLIEEQKEAAPAGKRPLLWSFRPKSTRQAGDAVVSNFLLHWFPAKTFHASLQWNYSLWLGTASAALFAILLISGVPLLFLYVPSVERAYASIKDLEFVVTFGSWLRSVHRLSAHLMVAVAFLHMVRVFITGAYKNSGAHGQRREWNWLLGMGLLLLTLLLSFTGYLLPWDQLAYWAVTVGTNIASSVPGIGAKIKFALLGGAMIGQSTLIRFYVLHVMVLPAVLGGLFVYHMWRVRKDGGLASADRAARTEQPYRAVNPGRNTLTLLGIATGSSPAVRMIAKETEDLTVEAVPNLVRRVFIVCIATVAIVTLLSALIPSPLEQPASPIVTPNPAKAPWYFLWLQEIVTDTTLRLGPVTINGAFLGGVLLPGALILLLSAWPWLDRSPASAAGVWFARSRARQNAIFLAITIAVVILTLIGLYCRGPYWQFYWPWQRWPELPTRF